MSDFKPSPHQTEESVTFGATTTITGNLTVALGNAFTVIVGETLINGTDLGAASSWSEGGSGGNSGDDWVIDTPDTKATWTFDAASDAANETAFLKQTLATMDATGQTLLASTYYKLTATFTTTTAFARSESYFEIVQSAYGGVGGGQSFSAMPDEDEDGEATVYFVTPSSLSGKSFMIAPYTFDAAESAGVFIIEDISLLDATLVTCVAHGLAVGQAVKLPGTGTGGADAIYTVSTVETDYFIVDSAAQTTVVGGTAYKDPTLLDIKSGDGSSFFSVTSAGGVAVTGMTSTGNNALLGTDAGGNAAAAAAGLVAVGNNAAAATTTGAGNTAVGFEALSDNVDGDFNTAVGYQALETFEADSDGHGKNTAVGYNAGQLVAAGTGNTIIGADAGDALNSGDDNTFIGRGSGGAATTITQAVAVGVEALGAGVALAAAVNTTAVGYQALNALTTGERNTAIGYSALAANLVGSYNTAVGNAAFFSLIPSAGTGENTAVGHQAGSYLTTGTGNTFVGSECALGITGVKLTGASNTAVGKRAGYLLQGAAASNTLIGETAGDVIKAGTNNVCIGRSTDPSAHGGTNQIVIGYNTTGLGDNFAVIGNASISRLYAAADGAAVLYADGTINTSDKRIKENIEELSLGLDFINKLSPVKYEHRQPIDYDSDLKEKLPWHKNNTKPRVLSDIEKNRSRVGLVAQDVVLALEELGFNSNNDIVHIDEDTTKQHLDYSTIVAPLIKAVQELSAKVEELEAKLENQ